MFYKFICFNLIIISIIKSSSSRMCYNGDLINRITDSNVCTGTNDTCKLTITYLASDLAFQAFPTSTFTCVTASDDDDLNTGCKNCNTESLNFSLNDLKQYSFDTQDSLPQICNFKSADGLSTTYCSQKDNGNRPAISFSCYTGTFSAETPKQPTVCGNSLSSNQDFCATSWNTDPITGEVSAIGSCSSYGIFDGAQYGDNAYQTVFCNGNNCNNVLICYTGTYYQYERGADSMENEGDRANTFKASLCNFDQNQVCQLTLSYNKLYGYTFQGACKAQGQCTAVPVSLTGTTETKGTFCCTTQYCNSISNAFHLRINNSNQIKSISSVGFLSLLLLVIILN